MITLSWICKEIQANSQCIWYTSENKKHLWNTHLSRGGTKGAHMLLEKQEIFVGLNGINIGKENGMRAGLYNSPSPSQLRRKSLERRNSSRRRPNYPIFLVIAGILWHSPSCLGTVFLCHFLKTWAWIEIKFPWSPDMYSCICNILNSGESLFSVWRSWCSTYFIILSSIVV